MGIFDRWQREPGVRLQGSRDLDSAKLQAPGIVRLADGRFRMFYTAVGPAKPFPVCQGYLLSAISADGLTFHTEPGIRLAPRTDLPQMELRVLAPSLSDLGDGRWRMYFEARGVASHPTAICSAISTNMLDWTLEAGTRLITEGGVGGPRFVRLPDGRGRLYCFRSEYGPGGIQTGQRISTSVISAVTTDGLQFDIEPDYRVRDKQSDAESAGITAAEVIPPTDEIDHWTMFYSAWQDIPAGVPTPLHPSHDANAVASGKSLDFAAASIASDMSGYRSRIFTAFSSDGLEWQRGQCIIDGAGYGGDGPDAVHAEDMSLIRIGPQRYRMYYAACDASGVWRIASAVNFV